ncbi:MAG: carboxypeptidase-like regulatory domain-containing protein [Tunicatimonas sp.]
MYQQAVLSILLLFIPALLFAQEVVTIGDSTRVDRNSEVVLAGRIRSEDGKPLGEATVSIPELARGTSSNRAGDYRLVLPVGEHRLTFQYIGMEPVAKTVRLYASGTLDIILREQSVGLDEVIIQGRAADENVRGVGSGVEKLNIETIKSLPAFLGEVDVVKSLLLLPGVSTVGEGASGFNVRGGRVDQNLVLQNGALLLNSSHVLGFFSVFNPDVSENFTLYKGHVPAQYGGRLSSVLTVDTRNGSYDDFRVQGGLGLVSSRLAVEGPIIKDKTSFLVGGRISYSDWILRQVRQVDVRQSSASFYDLNGLISHQFTPNNRLSIGYYGSEDYFRYSDQFGYTWGTQLLNLRWKALLTKNWLSNFSAVRGVYRNTFFDPAGFDAFRLRSGLRYYQFKQNFTVSRFANQAIDLGAEYVSYDNDPTVSGPFDAASTVGNEQITNEAGREMSLYANDEITISPRVSVSVGLRYTLFQNVGPYDVFTYQNNAPTNVAAITDTIGYASGEVIQTYGGLEPRLAVRFQLNASSSIKLGYNRMRQYLHQISHSTSPTPVDIWQLSNRYIPPQVADNVSLGFFRNFRDNQWETSVEVYGKRMDNLVEYKDFAELLLNEHLETELLAAEGRAYGGELYIKKNQGKWTGWLSYAYARTWVRVVAAEGRETVNQGDWYPANFDKPHNVTLVAKRQLGEAGSFSTNFTYSTGRPAVIVVSSYIDGNTTVPVFSERNQYRIPNYVRLDISFTTGKLFSKGPRYEDNLTISVYNLLSRDNAFSVFYRRTDERVLPQAFKFSVLGAAFPALTYNFNF